MFEFCSEMTSVNLKKFDTKNVESTAGLFASCKNLPEIDISNFDLSK